MDRYAKELATGKLEWGPLHTERFWRTNAGKLDVDDFKHVCSMCGVCVAF